jgi:uncharacterized protein (TIGR02996 family)
MTIKGRQLIKSALGEAPRANPDDTASHAADADLLLESDDPGERVRGEFISVQLALENDAPFQPRRPGL